MDLEAGRIYVVALELEMEGPDNDSEYAVARWLGDNYHEWTAGDIGTDANFRAVLVIPDVTRSDSFQIRKRAGGQQVTASRIRAIEVER